MVIGERRTQSAAERAFAENNDMVQTLAADRAHHTLGGGALPRRPWSRQHLLDSHGFHLLHKLRAEDAIPIPQQIPRGTVPGKGFAQLVAVHSAVGWAVTPKCTMRRRSWTKTRNTYRT
jgi:hypothetical protein